MACDSSPLRKMTEAWTQPTVRKSTVPSPLLKTSKASSAFSSFPASILPLLLAGTGVIASAFSEVVRDILSGYAFGELLD